MKRNESLSAKFCQAEKYSAALTRSAERDYSLSCFEEYPVEAVKIVVVVFSGSKYRSVGSESIAAFSFNSFCRNILRISPLFPIFCLTRPISIRSKSHKTSILASGITIFSRGHISLFAPKRRLPFVAMLVME